MLFYNVLVLHVIFYLNYKHTSEGLGTETESSRNMATYLSGRSSSPTVDAKEVMLPISVPPRSIPATSKYLISPHLKNKEGEIQSKTTTSGKNQEKAHTSIEQTNCRLYVGSSLNMSLFILQLFNDFFFHLKKCVLIHQP